jgi:hypothetical protein
VEKKSTIDGEKFEKTEQVGKSSGMPYIDGEVYTLAELQEKFRNDQSHSTLLSNIKNNGYKHAVQCNTGNWQPFEKNDVLVKV